MARNKHTRYKISTDLRGQFVELRNGSIFYIPPTAQRESMVCDYIQYWLSTVNVFQNLRGETLGHYLSPNDIMKVLHFTDRRVDLSGRLVRLRNKEEFKIPEDADQEVYPRHISYYGGPHVVFQGGVTNPYNVIKVLA